MCLSPSTNRPNRQRTSRQRRLAVLPRLDRPRSPVTPSRPSRRRPSSRQDQPLMLVERDPDLRANAAAFGPSDSSRSGIDGNRGGGIFVRVVSPRLARPPLSLLPPQPRRLPPSLAAVADSVSRAEPRPPIVRVRQVPRLAGRRSSHRRATHERTRTRRPDQAAPAAAGAPSRIRPQPSKSPTYSPHPIPSRSIGPRHRMTAWVTAALPA